MSSNEELRHLLIGLSPNDTIKGIGIVRFNIYCPGNADTVLKKCKEVLEIILRESALGWPSDNDWQKLLPKWFIQRCPEPQTEKETEKWLEWWRSLSPEEQIRVNRESEWALIDWIPWLHPDERQWFWWDAIVENQNLLRVAIEVQGWPFPWGELDWLLRASGATCVCPEDE